jgi:hypothetical protein
VKTLHLAFGVGRKGLRRPPIRIVALVRERGVALAHHEVHLSLHGGDFVGGLEVPGFGQSGQARELVAILANTTWGTGAKDGSAVTYAADVG